MIERTSGQTYLLHNSLSPPPVRECVRALHRQIYLTGVCEVLSVVCCASVPVLQTEQLGAAFSRSVNSDNKERNWCGTVKNNNTTCEDNQEEKGTRIMLITVK